MTTITKVIYKFTLFNKNLPIHKTETNKSYFLLVSIFFTALTLSALNWFVVNGVLNETFWLEVNSVSAKFKKLPEISNLVN